MNWIRKLFRKRERREAMPPAFNELATYNYEKASGIVHTPEYVARMEELQRDFDEWRRNV